jgi:hypothetical protein
MEKLKDFEWKIVAGEYKGKIYIPKDIEIKRKNDKRKKKLESL